MKVRIDVEQKTLYDANRLRHRKIILLLQPIAPIWSKRRLNSVVRLLFSFSFLSSFSFQPMFAIFVLLALLFIFKKQRKIYFLIYLLKSRPRRFLYSNILKKRLIWVPEEGGNVRGQAFYLDYEIKKIKTAFCCLTTCLLMKICGHPRRSN